MSTNYLVACLAGACLPLAFAPFGFYPLAIISPFILLMIWQRTSPWRAFFLGGLYGLGCFGVGVSWVYVSIHEYGNTSAALASVFTSLFILILALFPAIHGYVLRRYFGNTNPLNYCLAFPALWVLLEMIRGSIFTGFPWLVLGYSQTNSPLHSFAPVIGGFGLSFLITLQSGLLLTLFITHPRSKFYSGLCLCLVWTVAFCLETVQWTQTSSKPLQVSLIQGNIAQDLKWLPEQITPTLALYHQLTNTVWDSQLIIWPEAAIPLSASVASDYLGHLDREAKSQNAALITGIPIETQDQRYFYNALIIVGQGHGQYYKRYLVPFGEYVPFEFLLRGIIGFFNIPMSNFIAGPADQPQVTAAGLNIAPFICYEIAYANAVRAAAFNADILVTISNDGWFGNSLAPAQHLQIAQLRALETGRYLLFSTNTGITAIINPDGKIQTRAPQFQQAVLRGTVTGMSGVTPWYYVGTWPVLVVLICLLIMARLKNDCSLG